MSVTADGPNEGARKIVQNVGYWAGGKIVSGSFQEDFRMRVSRNSTKILTNKAPLKIFPIVPAPRVKLLYAETDAPFILGRQSQENDLFEKPKKKRHSFNNSIDTQMTSAFCYPDAY